MCGADWSINDASVVCRMLGFDGALEAMESQTYKKNFGYETVVSGCNGSEEQLQQCDNFNLKYDDCSSYAITKCIPQHSVFEKG